MRYANPSTLEYRLGEIQVSVCSELDDVLDEVVDLYRGCRSGNGGADRRIDLEIKLQERVFPGRRRYCIRSAGRDVFTDRPRHEVVPYLEWGINRQLIVSSSDRVHIHAATVARGPTGVVLAGHSGAGKSTLAALLLARGWTYLCDEFALIDPVTLLAHPFPKALCLKDDSFPVVERAGLCLARRRHFVRAFRRQVGYVNSHEAPGGVSAEPRPVRFIVFPRYAPDRPTGLHQVSRARATFLLAALTFNRPRAPEHSVSVLTRVVQGARCFELDSGTGADPCDLLEAAVAADQSTQHSAG